MSYLKNRSGPLLSIVLPVYNDSNKIEKTLENLRTKLKDLQSVMFNLRTRTNKELSAKVEAEVLAAVLTNKELDAWYEIIVVNDGSTDGTCSVVEKVTKLDKRIKMISYHTNMGKGHAIKQGILSSHGKYVVFMDGDGEISGDLLASYLENLEYSDIIIASKYHPSSIVNVPRARRFLSRCFNTFVKTALPVRVSDTQVGLKAGRGDAFRAIFESVLVKRYAFDVEMLAVATLLGLRIKEMPVKIDLVRHFRKKEIARMALDVLAIAYRLRIIKWYQKRINPNLLLNP